MIKNLAFLICIIQTLISCSKVEPKRADVAEVNFEKFKIKKSQYQNDKSADIFLESPWYIYDENNHIIWPIFSIYSIRTQGTYYKLQFIDYYNSQAQPGFYQLRVAKESETSHTLQIEAQGCGNVYTNADFENCVKDPNKNIYTYLNLENKNTFKASDDIAKVSKNWHIAFNGTNVKLNSGKNGPSDVTAANLFTYTDFYKNDIPDFQSIAEVSFSDKGERFFELELDPRNVPYSLPPGISRVIHETQWYQTNSDNNLRIANNKNWWLIRGSSGKSFFKFNISEILENYENETTIETSFVINSYYQNEVAPTFDSTLRTWKLPSFSSSQRRIKICYDLDEQQIVECKSKLWEIKFSALNKKTKRRWKIEVSNGAIGPISFQDIISRETGRNL